MADEKYQIWYQMADEKYQIRYQIANENYQIRYQIANEKYQIWYQKADEKCKVGTKELCVALWFARFCFFLRDQIQISYSLCWNWTNASSCAYIDVSYIFTILRHYIW